MKKRYIFIKLKAVFKRVKFPENCKGVEQTVKSPLHEKICPVMIFCPIFQKVDKFWKREWQTKGMEMKVEGRVY